MLKFAYICKLCVHAVYTIAFTKLMMHCVLFVTLKVPLEVINAATLKPKHGVFVKFEHQRSA